MGSDDGPVRIVVKFKYQPEKDSNCVNAQVTFSLQVEATSTRLDWIVDKQFVKQCEIPRKEWIRTIETHEAGHVADVERLKAEYNAQLKNTPRKYRTCGKGALEQLEKAVKADATTESSKFDALTKETIEAYHDKYGDSAPTPDCCRKGYSFNDTPINFKFPQETWHVYGTYTFSGEVCGDPIESTWRMRLHTLSHFVGHGPPLTTQDEMKWPQFMVAENNLPPYADGHQARLLMLTKRPMPGNHGVATTPDHSFPSVRASQDVLRCPR